MKKNNEFQGNVTLNSTVQDNWEDVTAFKYLKFLTSKALTTGWPFKCHLV